MEERSAAMWIHLATGAAAAGLLPGVSAKFFGSSGQLVGCEEERTAAAESRIVTGRQRHG